jgi:hypothetical protein
MRGWLLALWIGNILCLVGASNILRSIGARHIVSRLSN